MRFIIMIIQDLVEVSIRTGLRFNTSMGKIGKCAVQSAQPPMLPVQIFLVFVSGACPNRHFQI